jgi:hypothetical protein
MRKKQESGQFGNRRNLQRLTTAPGFLISISITGKEAKLFLGGAQGVRLRVAK